MKAKELKRMLERVNDDAEILITIGEYAHDSTWWDFEFDDGGNAENALLRTTEEMMN